MEREGQKDVLVLGVGLVSDQLAQRGQLGQQVPQGRPGQQVLQEVPALPVLQGQQELLVPRE